MSARITLIAAMGTNRVIGRAGGLPWRLPADLRHFRAQTLGKPVIMGRRTCESLDAPLRGRINAVVTRREGYRREGFDAYPSLEAACAAFADADEIMIIGGASIYRQALPHADRIHVTLIHHPFEGDTLFPDYDATTWRETEREDHAAGGENPFDYSFLVLERRGADRDQSGPAPVRRSSRGSSRA